MDNLEIENKQEIVEDSPIEQIITDEFITRFEKQAELYQKRYLPICLRLTNEADWILHGTGDKARYSLQCSGAEKLCNPLGINWDRPVVIKHEMSDERGRYYEYEVEGIVQSKVLKRWGWFTGNCDSRDTFFVARGNFAEGDIRKAAFSNWLVNAVTRLAGIRNPSKSMLEKAGLNSAEIGSIDYTRGKTPQADTRSISEAQLKRLWALAKNAGVSTDAIKKALVQKYKLPIEPETDEQMIAAIKRQDYEALCDWVQKGGKPNGGSDRQPGEEG